MIFNAWFGFSEHVGYFPYDIKLTVLISVSIWSLSTSTGLPERGTSPHMKSPVLYFLDGSMITEATC